MTNPYNELPEEKEISTSIDDLLFLRVIKEDGKMYLKFKDVEKIPVNLNQIVECIQTLALSNLVENNSGSR